MNTEDQAFEELSKLFPHGEEILTPWGLATIAKPSEFSKRAHKIICLDLHDPDMDGQFKKFFVGTRSLPFWQLHFKALDALKKQDVENE